ncbi:hemerythrin domain-containing protein [Salaquimonas pukyongi]|uniref:hemerythrin domain-containing protein n=1 Tax=Salaquimonas pukyongi TaxID=2712698 RepID=UPI00096B9CCF|nr:hemerythrin domain-containing protein [Salaquimonas pukyongi]
MPTIYEAIRKDHDHHRTLLETLADTQGDSAKRSEAWDEFYYDVKSHAAAEEEAFYSKLMEKAHGQDDARHSVHEHQQIDDIMEELNEMDMSSPGWLTRFKTLKHEYEHHMEEEENDIFSKARDVLTDDTDGRIASEFLTRKDKERLLVDEKAAASLED